MFQLCVILFFCSLTNEGRVKGKRRGEGDLKQNTKKKKHSYKTYKVKREKRGKLKQGYKTTLQFRPEKDALVDIFPPMNE